MKNIFRKKILFGQFIIVTLLAAIAFEGVTMSLFSKSEEEVVLFSEMEGYITYNGEPVKNVKIERRVNWKDDIGDTDYVSTDDKGYFIFPEIKEKIKLSGFTQFVANQEVKLNYLDKEYVIWTLSRMSKNQYGELNGKPVNFRCEITDEDVPIRLEDSYILTSCKWDKVIKIGK